MPVLHPTLPRLAGRRNGVRAAPVTSGAPVSLVAPFVSGTATTGQVLSCNGGAWSGAATIVLTYQWKRDAGNIASATASTYTLVQADEGTSVLCAVTATNGSGNASQNSNTVSPVAAITRGPLLSSTSLASDTPLYADGIDS